MQDELKLYAHADNEFEAEADEYPDEIEDGFEMMTKRKKK